ncbi:hypothetical protein [Streptomyces sp. NPDC004783]|uniref:hypothetical protein n=1 Tax=Streptomyces sp. NPDC004783 TaxID=3154459 RepID=UPI0033BB6157
MEQAQGRFVDRLRPRRPGAGPRQVPGPRPIAAGFLRYLADEVGKDIVRAKGHRPCAELDKPLLCRPDR